MVLVRHHDIGKHRIEESLGDDVFEALHNSEQSLVSEAEIHDEAGEHDRPDLFFVKICKFHRNKGSERQRDDVHPADVLLFKHLVDLCCRFGQEMPGLPDGGTAMAFKIDCYDVEILQILYLILPGPDRSAQSVDQ